MFPTTAVAPSLPSITFHCGVDFGSHRFRDTWQNITEWLIFSCAMTMEVQRQTCACRFCLCVKPGILPSFHSQFSRTKEGPDLKAGFLKHQIFKYTWNLNPDFTTDLVSSVCAHSKADLHYAIRNHAITFNCPVQASSLCTIQPPWLQHFSGRVGLEVSVLLLGSMSLLAVWQCWLNLAGGDLPSTSGELCFWKSQTKKLIPQVLSGEIFKHGNQG